MLQQYTKTSPVRLLAGLVVVAGLTSAQFTGDNPPCNVCGGDGVVQFPSVPVPIPPELEDQVPAGFTITCGILEMAGAGGVIPAAECATLQGTAEFGAL